MRVYRSVIPFVVVLSALVPAFASGQTGPGQAAKSQAPKAAPAMPVAPAQAVTPPPGYVIGPDDVLTVLFWREKDMSVEVSVRPDGMITLPVINEVKAAGLTPEQLRATVTEAAGKYVEEPSVTIAVKQINSRKVFVTGQVAKPGPYPLTGPTTVLQAIATAGGLVDFAKSERIMILRTTGTKTGTFKFNYKDVSKGNKLEQNIELQPGDTVVVP
jgi:polysaccharide biosynthesis/export protein